MRLFGLVIMTEKEYEEKLRDLRFEASELRAKVDCQDRLLKKLESAIAGWHHWEEE